MPTIARLFGELPARVRCEDTVSVPQHFRGRNKAFESACRNFATYDLDGKKLCVRHAQQRALEILLVQSASA